MQTIEHESVAAMLRSDGVCHDCGAAIFTDKDALAHASTNGFACADHSEATCPNCGYDSLPDGGPTSVPHPEKTGIRIYQCTECESTFGEEE